jgi:hypothetical protein
MTLFLWILALLTSAAAGGLTYRADRRRGAQRPWLTAGLRTLLALLLWALLLSPTFPFTRTEERKPVIVLLQDDSRSMSAALKSDTAGFRKVVESLRENLSKEARVVTLGFSNEVRTDSLFQFGGNATEISGALRAALERSGQRSPAAVILATDGRYNAGGNPLYEPLPLEAPLHILAVGDSAPPKDLRWGKIYAPRTVQRGSPFEVRGDVLADACDGASPTAALATAGGSTLSSQTFSINGTPFDRSVSFTITAGKAGLYTYFLQLPVLPGEANSENNVRRLYVEVVDQKRRLLLAAAAPHPDLAALREALSSLEGYEVQLRIGAETPNTTGYDAAIFHGLPAGANGVQPTIPTWFILTPTTGTGAFNSAQKVAALQSPTTAQRPAFGAAGGGFTLFEPPAGLAAVLDRLPPLFVPAAALKVAPDAQILIAERGSNAPLWMFRAQAPAQVVTVGEGLWRWRLAEYKNTKDHRVVDECIRQTVAFLAASAGDRKFRIELPKREWNDGEGITMRGYLLNAAGQNVNSGPATVVVTDSSGRSRTLSMVRNSAGYTLSVGALLPGPYSYRGTATADGKTYTDAGRFTVGEVPAELLQTGGDYPLLYALAGKYGGTVRPWQQAANLEVQLRESGTLKPRLESLEEPLRPIDWKWYFGLILLVAAAEWLIRRYGALN